MFVLTPSPDRPQQEELTGASRLSIAGSPLAMSLSMASVNFGKYWYRTDFTETKIARYWVFRGTDRYLFCQNRFSLGIEEPYRSVRYVPNAQAELENVIMMTCTSSLDTKHICSAGEWFSSELKLKARHLWNYMIDIIRHQHDETMTSSKMWAERKWTYKFMSFLMLACTYMILSKMVWTRIQLVQRWHWFASQ
jgi:hypothetical protein